MPATKNRKKKPSARRKARRLARAAAPRSPLPTRVRAVLADLERLADRRIREEMGTRYGIHTPNALGVRMAAMHGVARAVGPDHDLAVALWKTGGYEARTVAVFVAEPERVTPALMESWCRDFDNWAICDTACFHLFDRTPRAFGKVSQWARRRGEFQKRAAFALLASLAAHDKEAPDGPFVRGLALIEDGASDDRNFVKKGVSWALRTIGRRSPALNRAAVAVARRLAAAPEPSARWVGRTALKELTSRAVTGRLRRDRAGA
jgi:3-methyladenine DNA glycosylase AlkD